LSVTYDIDIAYLKYRYAAGLVLVLEVLNMHSRVVLREIAACSCLNRLVCKIKRWAMLCCVVLCNDL
jgi:hypothetical protein